MSKSGKIIIIVVLLLVIGVGAYVLVRDDDSSNNTGGSASNNDSSSSESSEEAVQSATIVYSDNGFSPSSVTVLSGATITVRNESAETLGFKSDPHPVHNENTELNIDSIEAGQSRSFTVETVGTWGFHNHLNPDEGGSITVVE